MISNFPTKLVALATTIAVSGCVLTTSTMAFQQPLNQLKATTTTVLNVAVDPTVVTKEEYQDIIGATFDKETLEARLAQRTDYLYPKHVEVIQDIEPLAASMVDEIVRATINEYYCVS